MPYTMYSAPSDLDYYGDPEPACPSRECSCPDCSRDLHLVIPTLAPQRPGEAAYDFGLRAFRFLLVERVPAGLLDTETLERALHASTSLFRGADTAPAALDAYTAVRRDMLAVVTRRQREAAEADKAARLAAFQAAAATPPPSGRPGDREPVVPGPAPSRPPMGAAVDIRF